MRSPDEYPVRVERSIAWGEMDAFQHVNNVHYFRFFEDARIEYFRQMGIYDPEGGEPFDGVGPILASTSCQFRKPLTYPEEIVVGARVTDVGDDRFSHEYAIFDDPEERPAALGESVVVTYDYGEAAKTELPEEWRRAIEQIESR